MSYSNTVHVSILSCIRSEQYNVFAFILMETYERSRKSSGRCNWVVCVTIGFTYDIRRKI